MRFFFLSCQGTTTWRRGTGYQKCVFQVRAKRFFFFSCKRAGDEKSEKRGEGMLAVLLGGGCWDSVSEVE